MGGTLVGRKETAEGDHRICNGKCGSSAHILTPPHCFITTEQVSEELCMMEVD